MAPVLFANGRVVCSADELVPAEHWSVAADQSRILAVGPDTALAMRFADASRIDLGGRLVTPGLIDCHTHLVHGGSRADEFARRLDGQSYREIAAAGGGILATVRATRSASEDGLSNAALRRLDAMLGCGVTTVEVKSGYGLDLGNERRQLRVARALGAERPVRIVTTALVLHALPHEAAHDRAGFVRDVAELWLPALAEEGLVDAVDGFLETIAFNAAEIEQLLTAARHLGLPVKLHADQLSDGGGAALAARYGALSADHLEYASEAGIRAMAAAGTVAVMLPGAFYVLRETRVPPVALFRRHGVRMALATDCNPGSAPLDSILLAMNMGATLFGMTIGECLAGTTSAAAQALGLGAEIGTIEPGKYCDLAIWDCEEPAELVYRMGSSPLHARVWRGEWLPR